MKSSLKSKNPVRSIPVNHSTSSPSSTPGTGRYSLAAVFTSRGNRCTVPCERHGLVEKINRAAKEAVSRIW